MRIKGRRGVGCKMCGGVLRCTHRSGGSSPRSKPCPQVDTDPPERL